MTDESDKLDGELPVRRISDTEMPDVDKPEVDMEQQLVAYLDGELDPEASRRVDELLATRPEVREVMQGLDRTWEILDELESPVPAANLTQSTIEMVTIAAAKEAEAQRAEAPRRRSRRWGAAAVVVLVAAVCGYAVVGRAVPDRNQQFLRDLPILLRFDQYSRCQNDDLEFLRRLYESNLFDIADMEGMPDLGRLAMSSEDAQHCLDSCTADEKKQLAHHERQFNALPPERRDGIRHLHEQLQDEANAGQLDRVLWAYHQWLTTLLAHEIDTLLNLEPEQRIRRIAESIEAHRVQEWIIQYAIDHEERLTSQLREERWRGSFMPLRIMPDRLGHFIWQRWLAANPGRVPFSDEELEELRELLVYTGDELASMAPEDQRRFIAEVTLPAALRHRGAPLPLEARSEEFEKKLDDFFQNSLSELEREHLFRLSAEEMMRELRRLYMREQGGRRTGPRSRLPGMGPGPPTPDGMRPPRGRGDPRLDPPPVDP